ncbi:sulfurtransferase [Bdellovibrio bacteriovorus]|uniref:Thiosulfate sulfurtransferase n=1 Tax=Bdellovibrio bacteriovorus str. Tiberius TaxID=1069642 RepID=K7YWC5_BDEBC|nr:rhodanese-like domain-containing protein [Bdellovibrio bacteriovorus]AFY01973.1 thiosulfate sulfurtransferase [Bdellovibrio bacteriovorus str. Tiberius]
MKFVLIAALVVLSACQMKPTKVTVQEPVMGENVTAEQLIKGKTAILDARPAFEFNLAHVPGSINVRWEDFSQANPKSRGLLQNDLFAIARRLALVGVDPSTPVVVLGKGAQGAGEEGRVAWTLKVLGVKNVYTLVHTSYREMNTNPNREAPLVRNKPYWKPEVAENLDTTWKVFKADVTQNEKPVIVLDVRSGQEFALRNLSTEKSVKAPVVNFEWREFFDDKGLPSKKIERALYEKNISKDSRILVVSNHGVRSGAVVYALNFLGYKNATNFAGGYEQWK